MSSTAALWTATGTSACPRRSRPPSGPPLGTRSTLHAGKGSKSRCSVRSAPSRRSASAPGPWGHRARARGRAGAWLGPAVWRDQRTAWRPRRSTVARVRAWPVVGAWQGYGHWPPRHQALKPPMPRSAPALHGIVHRLTERAGPPMPRGGPWSRTLAGARETGSLSHLSPLFTSSCGLVCYRLHDLV